MFEQESNMPDMPSISTAKKVKQNKKEIKKNDKIIFQGG